MCHFLLKTLLEVYLIFVIGFLLKNITGSLLDLCDWSPVTKDDNEDGPLNENDDGVDQGKKLNTQHLVLTQLYEVCYMFHVRTAHVITHTRTKKIYVFLSIGSKSLKQKPILMGDGYTFHMLVCVIRYIL
ncbi:hypothetical protein HanRHA438_Chr00c07g0846481 [Helianthus annuus]|nr:hypothetical protein HanRHA438_Chr00c07g0846481 [Helianthus annuus]